MIDRNWMKIFVMTLLERNIYLLDNVLLQLCSCCNTFDVVEQTQVKARSRQHDWNGEASRNAPFAASSSDP